ncbi:hypothetical protein [Mesorhizobium sp.]|uniref:hypothetical protein n=1 Tax=Mesorhizobium sp. TaxID=1871066 RepID=UPI00121F9FBC|nr:hypothetical protein [Mesorhizobium sp.]TIN79768.1 MAG: hypothetical protein E5Y09_04855 [Mesorhizobium sp.]
MFSSNATADAVSVGVRSYVAARLDESKACIHEAAHAVSGRKLGFPVKWLSIDPDFIKNDSIAIATQNDWSSAVCMTIASPRLGPILNRRRMISMEDKDTVLGYGVVTMAGPIAEKHYDPGTYDIGTASGDVVKLAGLLSCVGTRVFERKKLWRNIIKATTSFVNGNWPAIQMVASSLTKHRTIMEDELDAIIAAFGNEVVV